MKKWIIISLISLFMIPVVSAITIENRTNYHPSQSNFFYIINKTITGVVTNTVNETCMGINTTYFCGANSTSYMTYMEIIILGNFSLNIDSVGIEWTKLSWTTGGTAQIQFSNDSLTWENITFVNQALKTGYQINLDAEKTYYFRGRNTTSNFVTVSEETKVGGLSEMEIALVIGVSLIVLLFIILTFAVKDSKPFLANFFFLGIFIFATLLSNLLLKITIVKSAEYEPIMFILYRMFLVITMLMMFVVLTMLTVEAVKLRKWKGNPVDVYRDNLGKNE